MDLNVIIPAGGSGSRFGGQPKQYRMLGDHPVLVQTASAFARWNRACHVWIVVPHGDQAYVAGMFADYPGDIDYVVGGRTRQESVLNALREVSGGSCPPGDEGVVFVHDAVRPFVDGALLDRVMRAAERSGAAAPAVAVFDTLRTVDGAWFGRTVGRDGLYRMQTPQAFRFGRILAAHEWAASEGINATDDVELYIRFGGHVEKVEGAEENLKITTVGDLYLARDVWERLIAGPSARPIGADAARPK